MKRADRLRANKDRLSEVNLLGAIGFIVGRTVQDIKDFLEERDLSVGDIIEARFKTNKI